VLAALLSTAGCSSSDRKRFVSDLVFSCDSQPDPPRVGNNVFSANLGTANRQPLEGARISLEVDMTHPGMAPSFVTMQPATPGRYQAALNLSMPGDYTLLFHITLADGRRVERETQLRNVRPQ
jgi:YtkA-like